MIVPEELAAAMRRRIPCPVPWCSGRYLDHGGDGADPELWAHSMDERIVLPGDGSAIVSRWREGTSPDVWSILIRGGSTVVESESRSEIAATLRAWADAVERLED